MRNAPERKAPRAAPPSLASIATATVSTLVRDMSKVPNPPLLNPPFSALPNSSVLISQRTSAVVRPSRRHIKRVRSRRVSSRITMGI